MSPNFRVSSVISYGCTEIYPIILWELRGFSETMHAVIAITEQAMVLVMATVFTLNLFSSISLMMTKLAMWSCISYVPFSQNFEGKT